jgi:hypothetical protein
MAQTCMTADAAEGGRGVGESGVRLLLRDRKLISNMAVSRAAVGVGDGARARRNAELAGSKPRRRG